MKVNIQELTGSALDYAVAVVQGLEDGYDGHETVWVKGIPLSQRFMPSSDWFQGGLIIEREGIVLLCPPDRNHWDARMSSHQSRVLRKEPNVYVSGLTPLIAAMRCYVSAHFETETVEIPDKLMQMQKETSV
jgi:hypothetical protein